MNAPLCRPIARPSWTAIVKRRCLQAGARNISLTTVSITEGRSEQMMAAPRTKSHESRRQSSTVRRTAPSYAGEEDLPPITLLNTARKSGALHMTSEKVLDFLRDFQTQSAFNNPGWNRNVCLNHDIDPWTLGLIASILGKCELPGQKQFGAILLATAAKFGDRASLFSRVHEAVQVRRLNDVPEALQQVGIMAKRDNDPQAMTLLGMALYSQEMEEEALAWLQKATAGSLDFHGAANALVLEGRILMTSDIDDAKVAFQRAASELDDPTACFYLSKLQAPGSAEQVAFLTQAATSGVMEACHNLGVMEMAKMKQGSKMPKSLVDYGLALDWSLIAAEGGFGFSMLNLALMCKSVGQREEAMRWLEKAEGKADIREEAQSLRAKWESEDVVED